MDIRVSRPGLAAYAALLALALFQLGFAMHQAEHAAADLGDFCVLCSHYDNIDKTLVAAQVHDIALSTERIVPALPSLGSHVAGLYPNKVRAPPAV